jgi:hypothetical protein
VERCDQLYERIDEGHMAHVLEDIASSGWTPNGSMHVTPAHPDRNFDIPPGAPVG